jgi:hypothetical protein
MDMDVWGEPKELSLLHLVAFFFVIVFVVDRFFARTL